MCTPLDDFDKLTWKCHMCGEERPNDKISVYQHEHDAPIVYVENVRFCVDRRGCFEAAAEYCFFGTPEKHRF